MNNLVSIIEIPVADLVRAIEFYQTILGVSIEQAEMAGTQMGILPGSSETVSVVLVKGTDYSPSQNGALVYFAVTDLSATLKNVEHVGGSIVTTKTEISPEMGFFAIIRDSEGNRVGLHCLS